MRKLLLLLTLLPATAPAALAQSNVSGARIQGNVSSGSTDAGDPVKIGGKATTRTSLPTAVTNGQRTDAWHDLDGAQMVRAGFRTTYTANYRLTTRPYALSKTFTANTAVQFATIYHGASSTKTVRIREVKVYVKNSTVAAVLLFELRRLSATTAPATGNPAVTPILHNTASAAAEATCLALPGTAGSEAGANQGWGSQEISLGVTGTASTVNPPSTMTPIVLWQDDGLTEEEPLIMRAGVAEGFAVIIDSSAATVLTATVVITFSEE